MANVTYDDVDTRGDFVRNSSWGRFADFDASADKTVPYYSSAYNSQINDLARNVTTPPAARPDHARRDPDLDHQPAQRLPVAMVRLRAAHGPLRRLDPRRRAHLGRVHGPVPLHRQDRRLGQLQPQRPHSRPSTTSTTAPTSPRPTACATRPPPPPARRRTRPPARSRSTPTTTSLGYTLGNCLNTTSAGGNNGFGISARDFSATTPPATTTTSAPTIAATACRSSSRAPRPTPSTVSQTNNVSVSFDTPA
jgi:iron complex outermembrane receptor protein